MRKFRENEKKVKIYFIRFLAILSGYKSTNVLLPDPAPYGKADDYKYKISNEENYFLLTKYCIPSNILL